MQDEFQIFSEIQECFNRTEECRNFHVRNEKNAGKILK